MVPNIKSFEPDTQWFRVMQPKITMLHEKESPFYLNYWTAKRDWLEFALV